MDLGLLGKTALVCGGSRGIGKAVALELAREGMLVTFCARGQDDVEASAKEIAAASPRKEAYGVVADLAKPDQLDTMVDQIVSRFGHGPDVLVWNAGGPPHGALLSLGDEALDQGYALHLRGAFHVIRRVVPLMIARRFGRVIALTSTAVKQPLQALGVSTAVRAGLHGLLKSLAVEVGATGVTVNIVMPGYTLTERLERVIQARAESEGLPLDAVLAEVSAEIPLGRLARPEDIASVVAFLASERAGYVHGQSVAVDGGFARGLF